MEKVKLAKTELKVWNDTLKRFRRFLPMLQPKKQRLQGEIAAFVAKVEVVAACERVERRTRPLDWAYYVEAPFGHLQ